MPIQNSEVADLFNKVADLLEIEGENQFRVRAYRDAARTVGGHSRSVTEMVVKDEDLTELPGIRKDLAGKIREIVESGKLSQAEELEKRTEPGLRELLGLPGLGRERVRELHERFGVRSLQELEEAAHDNKIRELPGFGKKTEQNILEAIEQGSTSEKSIKLSVAEQVAKSVEDYLKGIKAVDGAVVAGSYRRRQATIGDLDVVVASKEGGDVIEKFIEYEDVQKVVSKGKDRRGSFPLCILLFRRLAPSFCALAPFRFPDLQPQIPSSNSVRSKNLSHLEAIFWAIASSSARFFRATSAVSRSPARSASLSKSS